MSIRVAVVGLGWAGRSIWLPRLMEHDDFTVVAAVDSEPIARATAQRQVPGLQVLSTVEELGEVDLAVVAVPNHLHATVACRLLRKGIPVFLEKPVCLTSDEADQLAAAELAGGAVLLAGSAARYRGDVRAMCEQIREFGAIRHVELAWVRSRGVPGGGGWFTDRSRAGGGALVDLGWHLLDTLSHLVGPVEFTSVLGSVSYDFVRDGNSRAAWRHDDDAAAHGDVEDTARGFLVAENGISVALRASWASHELWDETRIVVDGTEGSATLRSTFGFSPNRLDVPVLTVRRDGEHADVVLPQETIGVEYMRQLDAVSELLRDPGSRGRAVDEVRRTIAVIERFYDSARLHETAA